MKETLFKVVDINGVEKVLDSTKSKDALAYWDNNKALCRVENEDGEVIIFDNDQDIVCLNPKD